MLGMIDGSSPSDVDRQIDAALERTEPVEDLGPLLVEAMGKERRDARFRNAQVIFGARQTADADLHQPATLLNEPAHDGAVRPVLAAEPVGQVGVGVDLHDRHVRWIIDQARHNAVGHGVFAAKRDEKLVAERPDALADGCQALFKIALEQRRRQDVEARGLGEIDERFLVECLDLAGGRHDGLRAAGGSRAVGNRFFNRQRQKQNIGFFAARRRKAEELVGMQCGHDRAISVYPAGCVKAGRGDRRVCACTHQG